jgi:phosphopantetheine adenylyltransferase
MLRFSTVYIIKVGDDLGSPTYWNTRLRDIDVRLNAVEAFTNVANNASQQIIDTGVARINDTLQPAITAAQAEVVSLSGSVSNVNSILTGLVSEAQGIVNTLQSLAVVDGGTF